MVLYLGWDITAIPVAYVVLQWASTKKGLAAKVGLAQDWSSICTPTSTHRALFLDQAIELEKPCSSRCETVKIVKVTT